MNIQKLYLNSNNKNINPYSKIKYNKKWYQKLIIYTSEYYSHVLNVMGFFNLTNKMIIKTQEEYYEKLARVEYIFLAEPDSIEGFELEELVKEIAEYELVWYPIGKEEELESERIKQEMRKNGEL